jgi:hypothetical protein
MVGTDFRGCKGIQKTSNGGPGIDLNRLCIPDDGGPGDALADFGGRFEVDPELGEFVEVYFRDIRRQLIGQIAKADHVFGSVAWFTCPEILAALSEKRGVSFVVQKEDWMRPDGGSRADLQRNIAALKGVERHLFGGVAGQLSTHGCPAVEPVRCLGNLNTSKSQAFPRAHNKFAVFCHKLPPEAMEEDPDCCPWFPYAVWTGSFNWTKTSGRSLENAVYISSHAVASAYFNEFQQLLALSEPLDMMAEWVAPEWRIGS